VRGDLRVGSFKRVTVSFSSMRPRTAGERKDDFCFVCSRLTPSFAKSSCRRPAPWPRHTDSRELTNGEKYLPRGKDRGGYGVNG
jgi:hypothetical protein